MRKTITTIMLLALGFACSNTTYNADKVYSYSVIYKDNVESEQMELKAATDSLAFAIAFEKYIDESFRTEIEYKTERDLSRVVKTFRLIAPNGSDLYQDDELMKKYHETINESILKMEAKYKIKSIDLTN